ncbi:MAG: F0F1 ATP synthase subunit B [Bacillota bacterium]|nr:F0F1 ATP synthase subunit B [Bacillota bacterium]
MEINFTRIVISTINFVILYFILKHYLFKPVNKVLDSREKGISERITKTEADSMAAEKLRLEREDSLKHLEEEGKQLIEDYKLKGEDLYKEIIAAARKDAEHAVERSKTEIRLQQEKAEEELKNEVINLALAFSEKALADSLDEAIHKKLINDFIVKVDK